MFEYESSINVRVNATDDWRYNADEGERKYWTAVLLYKLY